MYSRISEVLNFLADNWKFSQFLCACSLRENFPTVNFFDTSRSNSWLAPYLCGHTPDNVSGLRLLVPAIKLVEYSDLSSPPTWPTCRSEYRRLLWNFSKRDTFTRLRQLLYIHQLSTYIMNSIIWKMVKFRISGCSASSYYALFDIFTRKQYEIFWSILIA